MGWWRSTEAKPGVGLTDSVASTVCLLVQLLVRHGAALDAKSGSGTALHWASGEGEHRSVEKLIELGADVNAVNDQARQS